ncbi:hypothetical protein J6590_084802, partial [Homalodisca vitripennis]
FYRDGHLIFMSWVTDEENSDIDYLQMFESVFNNYSTIMRPHQLTTKEHVTVIPLEFEFHNDNLADTKISLAHPGSPDDVNTKIRLQKDVTCRGFLSSN